jgi:hypothetical protein
LITMEAQQAIIDLDDISAKQDFIARFMRLTGKWLVTMKPHRPKRSIQANKYLWVCYEHFRQFLALHEQFHEKEEIHEFFLHKFAARNILDPLTGEIMGEVGARSSKMDSLVFSRYVDSIRHWCMERFELNIPSPEEYKCGAYIPPDQRAA